MNIKSIINSKFFYNSLNIIKIQHKNIIKNYIDINKFNNLSKLISYYIFNYLIYILN